jgi:hypothetical protein
MKMFSVQQKREIAEKVQKILRETEHPELPKGEIQFELHVSGAEPEWSWADIRNNGSVKSPDVNPWNEMLSAHTPPAKETANRVLNFLRSIDWSASSEDWKRDRVAEIIESRAAQTGGGTKK